MRHGGQREVRRVRMIKWGFMWIQEVFSGVRLFKEIERIHCFGETMGVKKNNFLLKTFK